MENTLIVINSLSNWQVNHISRVTNSVSHGLAKSAVKQVIDQFWIKKILAVSVMFC